MPFLTEELVAKARDAQENPLRWQSIRNSIHGAVEVDFRNALMQDIQAAVS